MQAISIRKGTCREMRMQRRKLMLRHQLQHVQNTRHRPTRTLDGTVRHLAGGEARPSFRQNFAGVAGCGTADELVSKHCMGTVDCCWHAVHRLQLDGIATAAEYGGQAGWGGGAALGAAPAGARHAMVQAGTVRLNVLL